MGKRALSAGYRRDVTQKPPQSSSKQTPWSQNKTLLNLLTTLWVLLVTVPDWCRDSQSPGSIVPWALRCNLPWNFLNISLIPGMRHIVFSSMGMVSSSSRVTLLLLWRAWNRHASVIHQPPRALPTHPLIQRVNIPAQDSSHTLEGKEKYK